jgi:putative intracellular protease/amidase
MRTENKEQRGVMKSTAYLLIFDGLADWEPAHALCEINKSGKFAVVTAGFSRAPISTMAGLKLTPDVTVDNLNPVASIFILPGGDMWEKESGPRLEMLLRQLHDNRVPIAAICGATLEIARAGLTRGVRHTSNAKEFLQARVPDYKDGDCYVDQMAVEDKGIITASGLGSVEFAREVIKQLHLYSEADTQLWFEMFKHGVMPAGRSAKSG